MDYILSKIISRPTTLKRSAVDDVEDETGKPPKRNSLSTGSYDTTPTKFPIDKAIKSPKDTSEEATASNGLPDIVATFETNENPNNGTLGGLLNDFQTLSVNSTPARVNTNLLTVDRPPIDSHASSDDEAFLECNSFADESLLLRDTIGQSCHDDMSILNETELLNGTTSASCTPDFVDTSSIPADEHEANQTAVALADQTVCGDDLKDTETDRDSTVGNTTLGSVNTTVCVSAETTPQKNIASESSTDGLEIAPEVPVVVGEVLGIVPTVAAAEVIGETTPAIESPNNLNNTMLINESPSLNDEVLLLAESSPSQDNITTDDTVIVTEIDKDVAEADITNGNVDPGENTPENEPVIVGQPNLNETVDMIDVSEVPVNIENSTAYLSGSKAGAWNFSHDESMEVDQDMAEPVLESASVAPSAIEPEPQILFNTVSSDVTPGTEIKDTDLTQNSLAISTSTGFSRSTFDDTVLPALAGHVNESPESQNEPIEVVDANDQGNLTQPTESIDVSKANETMPAHKYTIFHELEDALNATVAANNQTHEFEQNRHPDEIVTVRNEVIEGSDQINLTQEICTSDVPTVNETMAAGNQTLVFENESDLNVSAAATNQIQVFEQEQLTDEAPSDKTQIFNIDDLADKEIEDTPDDETELCEPTVDRTMVVVVVSTDENRFDENRVIVNTTIDVAPPDDEFANMTVNIDKASDIKTSDKPEIIDDAAKQLHSSECDLNKTVDISSQAPLSTIEQIRAKMKANICAHNESRNQPLEPESKSTAPTADAGYSAFTEINQQNAIGYALNDEDFDTPLNTTVNLPSVVTPSKDVAAVTASVKPVQKSRLSLLNRSSTVEVVKESDRCFNENAFMSSDSVDSNDQTFDESDQPPSDNDQFKVPAAAGPSSLFAAAASEQLGRLSATSSVSSLADQFGDQFGLGRIPATAEENEAEFNCMKFQSADFDFLLSKGQNSTQLPDNRDSLLLRFDPLLGRNVLVTQPSILEESLSMQENHSPESNQQSRRTATAANATMSVGLIQDIKTSDCDLKSFASSHNKMEHNAHSDLQISELERKVQVELLKSEDAEKKLKEAEQREEALIRRISEKDKTIAKMSGVLEQYEKAISELVAEKERVVSICEAKNAELRADRDANFHHLSSLETTFSDLHAKYERSKHLTTQLKECEDAIKAENDRLVESLSQQEQRYEKMKQHAIHQLDIANSKLETLTTLHKQELLKLQIQLKKEETMRESATAQLLQKNKENEELLKICDELINSQGSG